MRLIWLLIMLAASAGCSAEVKRPCEGYSGIEVDPPAQIKIELEKRGLSEYRLVRRTVCGDLTYWELLPPGLAVDQVTPPGLLPTISIDKDGVITLLPSDYKPVD